MADGASPLTRADLEASEGRIVEAVQRLRAGTEARFRPETTEIRAEVAELRTGLGALSGFREEYLGFAQRLERAETIRSTASAITRAVPTRVTSPRR